MDSTKVNLPLIAEVIVSGLGLITIAVYAWVASRVAKNGGKVPVNKFDIFDLLACVLLFNVLVLLSIAGFRAPERQIHDSDLITSAVVDFIVVATLCSFMYFRGVNLAVQLGLRASGFFKTVGLAVLLLAGFYPMMICATYFTQKIPGFEAKPQELIKFFSEAAHQKNYRTILYMFITGTVVAPIAEEFIFRGYIYGVLKRYVGITAGVLLNSALFAAVHASATAFPGLFLFAICLTLAYEFSGSIFVNICMHSMFNFCALTLVFCFSSQQ